ncbi:hypothetical protein FIM12_00635 [SAR202 cluster bacterium AD-804-J14_MRT_500m]|nr:hypothetical protein [SAR202 cluster bacterium AD-804-J14_MRT_500m]
MPKHFVVIRVDIGSELGQHIRNKYQAKSVPTFLVLDHAGKIALRHNGKVPELREILSLDF